MVAGIAALTAFVIVPFFQSLASATPDEATKDEVQVVETTAAPTEAATTTAPETTVAETTTAPATTVPPTTAVTPVISAHIKPDIADDGSKAEMATNTICIWNKQAFNLFYSGNKAAEYYADAINGYAKKLDKDVKVYNMVVGNHTEFGLPERLIKGGIQTDSQSDNIKHIIDNLSDRVTPLTATIIWLSIVTSTSSTAPTTTGLPWVHITATRHSAKLWDLLPWISQSPKSQALTVS